MMELIRTCVYHLVHSSVPSGGPMAYPTMYSKVRIYASVHRMLLSADPSVGPPMRPRSISCRWMGFIDLMFSSACSRYELFKQYRKMSH